MALSITIPAEVAVCPYCKGSLSVDITEWEVETGTPTECGIEMECDRLAAAIEAVMLEEVTAPDRFDVEDENRRHMNMPYIYWLPVHQHVIDWVQTRYRVASGPGECCLLYEEPPIPPDQEMRRAGAPTLL